MKNYESEHNRFLVMLYLYLLSKADRLEDEVIYISEKIKKKKKVSSSDFIEYYNSMIRYEMFEEVFDEIYNLLKYLEM